MEQPFTFAIWTPNPECLRKFGRSGTSSSVWCGALYRPATKRRSLLARNRKFADSPLEGDGFERSVPRRPGFVRNGADRPSALIRAVGGPGPADRVVGRPFDIHR